MKFNKEQIINALECCTNDCCRSCPIRQPDATCVGKLMKNALALINELTEENEKLQDFIKEVQEYNEAWVEDNGKLRKEMKALKTDTVQKMQDKIRAKSEYGTINISPWQLEQIAKEVLEESK